jgi:class 3 adenylate cyclase
MAKLTDKERAQLPDRAFAYIDSKGRRLLPINDEAHVRNALARFSQVRFESDAARTKARQRLLRAAKRYGIVPIGFVTSQLQAEAEKAEKGPPAPELPRGLVTLLFTDVEGSTPLLARLGDDYAAVIDRVTSVIRQSIDRHGGREVEVRADEYFAVFDEATPAVRAALATQRSLGRVEWPDSSEVRVRIGIHTGRVELTRAGYLGLTVNKASRVCSSAHGGQIIVSDETRAAVVDQLPRGVRLRDLGRYRLVGLDGSHPLFQVEAKGLGGEFAPPRTSPA